MHYREYTPDRSIAKYIDAYWTAKGAPGNPVVEKILPDGCVDLILNLGADCRTDNGTFLMESEKTYFVGTMTKFKETSMDLGTQLFGIRFKPGAFSAFYKFGSFHEVKDQTIEFEGSPYFNLKKISAQPLDYFNAYFIQRLNKEDQFLLDIVNTIKTQKGQLKVEALASRHFTTVRQLERSFKRYIGVSPKEFICLVRYQNAMATLQNRRPDQSLLSIAFECGYYDHAHLANDLKHYTGITPSQL